VNAVNLLNPRVIIIGGDEAHADHLLLAGVQTRSTLGRCHSPPATRASCGADSTTAPASSAGR
jgi:predicted NBD/HSP70 family sugar kinase